MGAGKASRKQLANVSENLELVSKALPALIRNDKVLSRAIKVGAYSTSVFEECDTIQKAIQSILSQNLYKDISKEQIGKLLFAVNSLSELSGIDAEQALTEVTNSFIKDMANNESL